MKRLIIIMILFLGLAIIKTLAQEEISPVAKEEAPATLTVDSGTTDIESLKLTLSGPMPLFEKPKETPSAPEEKTS